MSLPELESLVRTGQYTQAMRVFLNLLADSALERRDLAFAYHCAAVIRYKTDNLHSALEYARLAETNAELAQDHTLLGRIWVNMISILGEVGDTAEALTYGERWLANVHNYPELHSQRSIVHFHLAQTHRWRRSYALMFEQFGLAVEWAIRSGLPAAHRVHIHQVYAWQLYMAERIAEGDTQARLAEELVEESDLEGIREQLLLKCLRAYQSGDISQALGIAQEFLSPPAVSTKRQEFWADWIIGMVACDQGHYDTALGIGALAMEIAVELKNSEYMNKANEIRRRATHMKELHQGANQQESAG